MSINQMRLWVLSCRGLSVRPRLQKTPEAPDCLPLWPGRSKKCRQMSGQTVKAGRLHFHSALHNQSAKITHRDTQTNGNRDHVIYSKRKGTKKGNILYLSVDNYIECPVCSSAVVSGAGQSRNIQVSTGQQELSTQ